MFNIRLPDGWFQTLFNPETGAFAGNSTQALLCVALAYIMASYISARSGLLIEKVVGWGARKTWRGTKALFAWRKGPKMSPLCFEVYRALDGKSLLEEQAWLVEEGKPRLPALYVGRSEIDADVEIVLENGQIRHVFLEDDELLDELDKRDRKALLSLIQRELGRHKQEATAALVERARRKNEGSVEAGIGVEARDLPRDDNGDTLTSFLGRLHPDDLERLRAEWMRLHIGPDRSTAREEHMARANPGQPTTTTTTGSCGPCEQSRAAMQAAAMGPSQDVQRMTTITTTTAAPPDQNAPNGVVNQSAKAPSPFLSADEVRKAMSAGVAALRATTAALQAGKKPGNN